MHDKVLGNKSIKELDKFPDKLNVRIHLKYPKYEDILNLKPKERIKIIRQRQRDILKSFVSDFKIKEYNLIGSKVRPSGLIFKCLNQEIFNLNKDIRVEWISILEEEKYTDSRNEPREFLFAVQARFVIQIENKTKGLQTYEDRILLVKASNAEEAERKLQENFDEYEKPYINVHGELVRWKFEEFIECYETNYNSINDIIVEENEEEGIEVFSVLKSRRITKERVWKSNAE